MAIFASFQNLVTFWNINGSINPFVCLFFLFIIIIIVVIIIIIIINCYYLLMEQPYAILELFFSLLGLSKI